MNELDLTSWDHTLSEVILYFIYQLTPFPFKEKVPKPSDQIQKMK